MTPAVSVVMAVRNGAQYLPEALKSLWAQTFEDCEVVVVDDGSDDGEATRRALEGSLAAHLGTKELVVHHRRHEGLTRSLKFGIWRARAPLIARMDADDVCRPDRLARQVREFDRDPELGLCGTWAMEIDETGKALRQLMAPCDDAALRRLLIRRNPFVHASVMFRRDVYDRVGGYDERFEVGQDWELWLRMAGLYRERDNRAEPERVRLGMVNRVGLLRRVWTGQVSQARRRAQRWAGIVARYEAIQRGQYPKRDLARLVLPLVRCGL